VHPITKLAAFALLLLAMVGLGAAVGAAVGPIDVPPPPASHVDHEDG
jgi:hypothetical protein